MSGLSALIFGFVFGQRVRKEKAENKNKKA